MMVDSQKEATAAALTELGYDVDAELTVHSFTDDSAAEGVLEEGDVILVGERHAGGGCRRPCARSSTTATATRSSCAIERDGEEETVSVTPKETEIDGETTWLIGVTLMHDYEFPIDVTIQLNNVGGPSAGMMFALGIIDTLTPGELNGGENVAGTGTITADGTVGPIGGIRQKMWGAVDAGRRLVPRPGGELRRGRRPHPRAACGCSRSRRSTTRSTCSTRSARTATSTRCPRARPR